MKVVNKFQVRWQIIRCQAKKIKNVNLKIEFIKNFISNYSSKENYVRVKNWMTMTSLAYYKSQESKMLFTKGKKYLETLTYNMEDEVNDFSKFDPEDLSLLHKDLKKRKYSFFFNKVPSTHLIFVKELKEYITKKEL